MGLGDGWDYGQTDGAAQGNGANANAKGNNWLGYASDIMALYEAWKRSRDKKLDFTQVPLSPEQRELHQRAIKTFDTLPTAQTLGPMAMQVLQGYNGMGFQAPSSASIPKLGIQGAQGYKSGGTQIDFSKIPQFWKTGVGAGGGAASAPAPESDGGTSGGEIIEPRENNGMRGRIQRDQGAPEPYSDLGSEWGGAAPYLGNPGDGVPLSPGAMPALFNSDTGRRIWDYAASHGPQALIALGATGIAGQFSVPIAIAGRIWNYFRGRGQNQDEGQSGGGVTAGGRTF